jgi:hypothetical protein
VHHKDQRGPDPKSTASFIARHLDTLSVVSQITQFYFPLCPGLENGVRKRHEQKNSKELPTRQMVFDGPPDEKSSPNQNYNPIHEMDDD